MAKDLPGLDVKHNDLDSDSELNRSVESSEDSLCSPDKSISSNSTNKAVVKPHNKRPKTKTKKLNVKIKDLGSDTDSIGAFESSGDSLCPNNHPISNLSAKNKADIKPQNERPKRTIRKKEFSETSWEVPHTNKNKTSNRAPCITKLADTPLKDSPIHDQNVEITSKN